MTVGRIVAVVGFVLVGGWIWLRHPLGDAAGDLLPALAAFPLYIWLSRPWRWREKSGALSMPAVGVAVGFIFLGLAIDHTLLLALGWVLAWRAWLSTQLTTHAAAVSWKPMVLLVMGFPWLALEGQQIGWWFRYSGAWAAENWFALLGLTVERDGTFLTVQGLPLAVDAACSGLHALQSMLVAGTVMAWLVLPGRRFWVGVVMLPLLAWSANVLRILTLGVVGLSFGTEAAMGWFHDWGGWGVLMLMFVLCSTAFRLLAGKSKSAGRTT
ncbi:MAG: hypothetical protein SynsKO_00350 [Synoicihabitans sp.]